MNFREFYWRYFNISGSIESYLAYKNRQNDYDETEIKVEDGCYKMQGTCSE